MKVSTFLPERFETVEALAVVDILKRAGITVDLISVNDNTDVVSAQKIIIQAEYKFSEYDFNETDMLFLPGGPGTKNYESNQKLLEVVKDFHNQNKPIAAICAAPSVLGHLGILEAKKATCFPGYEQDLYGAEFMKQKVVTDGNIITAIGMGASLELGFEIVRFLLGDEIKEQLMLSTQYKI